jgi:hypothetical protein
MQAYLLAPRAAAFFLEPPGPGSFKTHLKASADLPEVFVCYLAVLLHFYFEYFRPPLGLVWQSDVLVAFRDPVKLVRDLWQRENSHDLSNYKLIGLELPTTTIEGRSHIDFFCLESTEKLLQWHDLWCWLPSQTQDHLYKTLKTLSQSNFYTSEERENHFFFETLRRQGFDEGDEIEQNRLLEKLISSQKPLTVQQHLQRMTYESLFHGAQMALLRYQHTDLCVFFRDSLLRRHAVMPAQHEALGAVFPCFQIWTSSALSLALANCGSRLMALDERDAHIRSFREEGSQALRAWKTYCLQDVHREQLGLILLGSWPELDVSAFRQLYEHLQNHTDIFWVVQFLPTPVLQRHQGHTRCVGLGQRLRQLRRWSESLTHVMIMEDPSFWPPGLKVSHFVFLGKGRPTDFVSSMNACFQTSSCSLLATQGMRETDMHYIETSHHKTSKIDSDWPLFCGQDIRDTKDQYELEKTVSGWESVSNLCVRIRELAKNSNTSNASFTVKCLFSGPRAWETQVMPALEYLHQQLQSRGGEVLLFPWNSFRH